MNRSFSCASNLSPSSLPPSPGECTLSPPSVPPSGTGYTRQSWGEGEEVRGSGAQHKICASLDPKCWERARGGTYCALGSGIQYSRVRLGGRKKPSLPRACVVYKKIHCFFFFPAAAAFFLHKIRCGIVTEGCFPTNQPTGLLFPMQHFGM